MEILILNKESQLCNNKHKPICNVACSNTGKNLPTLVVQSTSKLHRQKVKDERERLDESNSNFQE